jgi:hypothetical protein
MWCLSPIIISIPRINMWRNIIQIGQYLEEPTMGYD